MAIIACLDCDKEISDSAPACPNCGRPSSGSPTPSIASSFGSHPVRPVGFLLGLGIVIFPIIFAWFTLTKGRSKKSKVIAFGYLVLLTLFVSMQGGTTKSLTTSTNSSESQMASVVAPEEGQVIQNTKKTIRDPVATLREASEPLPVVAIKHDVTIPDIQPVKSLGKN